MTSTPVATTNCVPVNGRAEAVPVVPSGPPSPEQAVAASTKTAHQMSD
ncbi:hypothetical protein [Streptomyces sp. NPDC046261]